MRIIAGQHRGTHLADVGKGDEAAHLRPTSDRVRESVFSILTSGKMGNPVVGARVLDLFAGTGALGLEALSRGAVHATFVDSGKAAQALLAQNIAKLRREADCSVIKGRADSLPNASQACGLVFLDPPYGDDLGASALRSAQAQGWIAPEATIVWEERLPQAPLTGYALLEQRQFGDTWITFLKVTE